MKDYGIPHAITPCVPVATGDRLMCQYAADTILSVFHIYTVDYVLEDASGVYVAFEEITGAWARWRFVRMTGDQ